MAAHVVFVPGIQGSKLKLGAIEKWPALFAQQIKELKLISPNQVFDSEILDRFKLFNFYKGFIDALDEELDTDFTVFSYDWRHDLYREGAFIDLFKMIEDKDELIFIGHSMGGLFIKLFLHWGEKTRRINVNKIKKVITVATPWRGSPDAFWQLVFGKAHPRAWLVLTRREIMKEVASTFPSVYQLLPHDNFLKEHGILLDLEEKPLTITINDLYSQYFDYSQKQMYNQYCHPFQHDIAKPWPEAIETYAVIGYGYPTIDKAIIKTDYEKEKATMAAGDSTVPICYANPYDDKTTCYYVKDTHVGIIQNLDVIQWIIHVIKDNDTRMIGQIKEKPCYNFKGSILRVACPVNISIYENDRFVGGEAVNLEQLQTQLEGLFSSALDYSNREEKVLSFGESTYIITNNDRDTEYKIEGKGEGVASIEILNYNNGELVDITPFPSVQVKQGTVSRLIVQKNGKTTLINESSNVPPIEPGKIPVIKDRKYVKPKTNISYTLFDEKEVKINNIPIVQSPIMFKVDYTEIYEEEFLEIRLIANGQKHVYHKKDIMFYPVNGLNELLFYTVSVYGQTDQEPVKVKFIYDNQPPVTKLSAMLYPEDIRIHFIAEDDSGSAHTKYRFVGDQEWRDYYGTPLITGYNGLEIEYFSVDVLENMEKPPRRIQLPNESFKEKAFIQSFTHYSDLINELKLNPNNVDIKRRNGRNIYVTDVITRNPENLAITLKNGDTYSINFNRELEVLWSLHPVEILHSDTEEEFPFRFKILSKTGFVRKTNVKVKIVPKTKQGVKDEICIKVEFDEDLLEYVGFFGVKSVPRSVIDGELNVTIDDKLYRESRFKII